LSDELFDTESKRVDFRRGRTAHYECVSREGTSVRRWDFNSLLSLSTNSSSRRISEVWRIQFILDISEEFYQEKSWGVFSF
jgi:hypothetical protein